MHQPALQFMMGMLGAGLPVFGSMFVLVFAWSAFWKGLALWHAAQRGEGWWFIVLLVVNTAGILELIYLFAVVKLKMSDLFHDRRKIYLEERHD